MSLLFLSIVVENSWDKACWSPQIFACKPPPLPQKKGSGNTKYRFKILKKIVMPKLLLIFHVAASGTTAASCAVFWQAHGRCVSKFGFKEQGQIHPELDCIQSWVPCEVVGKRLIPRRSGIQGVMRDVDMIGLWNFLGIGADFISPQGHDTQT